MYKAFYRLQRNPFEITPDPSFLFPTTRHNEALATLYYGVTAHRGFVVLTGEVGTGKTLLLRSLLGLLQRRDTAFALIFNPSLSPVEFVRYIAGDFGLPSAGKAKDELIHLLNEILLLTNLETSQQKLLQIVLAGQPELDQKLDSHELRQLKQRVALRCHLDCLNLNETGEYMRRRLTIAGLNGGPPIFKEEAIAAVHQHSKGVPRLINTICENALLAGYAKQEATVTAEIVHGVASDLRLGVTTEKNNGTARAVRGADDENLLRAVKMLLEVRDRIQGPVDPKGRLQ